jgi:glutathione S-transferase
VSGNLADAAPALTIWGRRNLSNVQKVTWCAAELGLAVRRLDVGGSSGGTDTPSYRALNPNGTTPTIEDNGFILWESNAILRYLGARYGAGVLMPDDPVARADADRWMDWQLGTIFPPSAVLFRNLVLLPAEARDHAAILRARDELGRLLKVLDDALRDRLYVAGNQFTIGDIPLGIMIHRWFAYDIERPALPAIAAWYKRLTERHAFREHVMLPLE